MKALALLLITLPFLLLPIQVGAHSGRTDSSGGHNCNVGACAGTYHYHNGGSSYTPPPEPPKAVITTSEVKETEAIAYTTMENEDKGLSLGLKKVTQKGVNGLRTFTYKVTYSDGVQVSKDKIFTEDTTPPIIEIVAVGTKPEVVAIKNATSKDIKNGSPGDALAGFAILAGMGYGAYRLGKFGIGKLNKK